MIHLDPELIIAIAYLLNAIANVIKARKAK